MAIPEIMRRGALQKVEAYCERKVPPNAGDQVRAEVTVCGAAITIDDAAIAAVEQDRSGAFWG